MSMELQLKDLFSGMGCSLELGEEKSKNFKHWPFFVLVKVYSVSLWCSIDYLHIGLAQSVLLLFQHEQGAKYANILENHWPDNLFKHCLVLFLLKQCFQKQLNFEEEGK